MTRDAARGRAVGAARRQPRRRARHARSQGRRADHADRPERRRQDHADARARRAASRPTGRIELEGRPLATFSARERARRIAYLPQGHVFHWPMSVAAVVALGRHPHADAFAPLTDGGPRRRRPRARRHRGRALGGARGHHVVGRRARAGRAGARAGDASADPARRRAHHVARSAPPARGDGAAGPRRARRRRGAGDRARPRARRALCRPRRDDGARPAGGRRRRARGAHAGADRGGVRASRPASSTARSGRSRSCAGRCEAKSFALDRHCYDLSACLVSYAVITAEARSQLSISPAGTSRRSRDCSAWPLCKLETFVHAALTGFGPEKPHCSAAPLVRHEV